MNHKIIALIILTIIVSVYIGSAVSMIIPGILKDKYCQDIYGEEARGSTARIEPGYIECCYYVYADHRGVRECDICPYEK